MNGDSWKLYVHINKYNGKRYVGITSKDNPAHRWNSGRGYKENPHFYAAIQKYGWESFEHVIIHSDLTEEQAIRMEKMYIALWKTQDSDHGYNMTSGGDGTPGYHPSSETRKKLSKARMRENLSDETLRRRSDALKGRVFTDEHKRRIGEANSKPIIMFSKDGVPIRHFDSAREAEIDLGISHTHISQCCTGKRQSAGGYKWAFAQSA